MLTDLRPCWNCGSENPAGAKFCANCGKPQQAVCPECGTPFAEGAKFCANCGIPLGGPARVPAEAAPVLTAEARKVITALFVDLVDSTRLTERLDPEEARIVVGKFYKVVEHAVERFEGTVANYLGDGVLAVFGLPISHEDDPERAVRGGLAIRDAIPVLNEHLAGTHAVQLGTRVGINTGEVVAASGSTFDRDFLVSDAVTTAARLQQTVSSGAVVVGERTYRLTREVIEYRELPPVAVKGKAAPLAVWQAVAPLPERPESRRIAAPLIGRHGELGVLRHLYERTREEGLVHQVTVLGQAGVGKSRLLREFLAEVRDGDPPPLVLRGRGIAFGGQIGYHALIDVLRTQAGLMDTDAPEVVRAKLAQWLASALPEGTDLLDGLLLTFGTEDGSATTPELMRQRLFDSWRSLLVGLAAAGPVVVAFEDLHWADDGVLDLIENVSATIEGVPLFIVSLARPELLERRPRWGGGGRDATTLDLKPLRPQEAEQLVAALSSQGVAPEMRLTIAQRAGGNPLFVEELVRMLMEGSTPGAAIPDTVQAVITARIDRLLPDERRVLQAAAVIGLSFWPSAIAPLAGLSLEETQKAVDALIAKELVVSRPRSAVADEREFAFRQTLTRDVAYGLLPRTQRARAHAEAARWLEARVGERVEEVIEVLAEHVRLAGDDARAAAYLRRAANKARRLYANADAIRLFELALESAGKAGLPLRDVALIYHGRGEVYQLQGDYRAALVDFEAGLSAARLAEDQAVEALLENRVGFVHHRELRLDEAEAHFSRAVVLARQAGDRQTLGLSLIDLANVAWDRGEMGADHPMLAEGIGLLRGAGDLSGVARGLNLLGMAYFGAGDGAQAIAAAEEALAAARQAGDKSKEATSLSYLSIINRYLGRYQETLRYGQEALDLAKTIGDRRREVFTISFIVPGLIALGQWGEAFRLLDGVLRLLREYAKIHLPFIYGYAGLLAYELGDFAAARDDLAQASNVGTVPNPGWQQLGILAEVYRTRLDGDRAAENDALDRMLALRWGVFVPDDIEILLPVTEALLEVGRTEDARRFLAARRPDVMKWGASVYLAALAIAEALVAVEDGRVKEANVLLDEAVRQSQAGEDVTTELRARERRWQLRSLPEDRVALRRLLQRIADSLPEERRAIFLAGPRAVILREPS